MPVFCSTLSFQKYYRFREPPIRLPCIYRRSCDGELFRRGSACFSGQLRRSLRIPRPPRGRSLRSLHRGISYCMNPSPFDTFPILSFISPMSVSIVGRRCYCIVAVHWQPSYPASLWPLSTPVCPGGRVPCS